VSFQVAGALEARAVRGSRAALVSAVQNLVDNALQMGSTRVRVEVAVGTEDSRPLRVRVLDNGPGISSESLGRIFEPFYSTRRAGTGLGLAVVQAVVQSHGGRVEVASQPGRETVFTLELPTLDVVGLLPEAGARASSDSALPLNLSGLDSAETCVGGASS
jgi:two-component system sensor histidine kinase FlrB